ncbi:uncharacterized protein TNCV_508911 [Trichonephila clavipes]|nr:uncharacterized protein TNCV_508911 [Trichonephila clavipes]
MHAVPARQTLNADYYCSFQKHHLCFAMLRKRSSLLQNNLPIVLHGKGGCHTKNNVTLKLRRRQWEILEHPPPYLRDINPCDFYLFLKLKKLLLGCRSHDVSSVRRELGHSTVDINNQHFTNDIQLFHDTWQIIIIFTGDYVEGI